MFQFPISLLHWSQISFLGAFLWDLQTASSCWGLDLENRVGAEAIWSPIHVVLSWLWYSALSWWKSTFFFFICGRFFAISSSNTPIMLYNICYWWLFFSQGNWWTKYLVHPKIWRPKPCLLMFASLVALNGFCLLLSTKLTADLTPEWIGGSIFYPLSHIYTKTPFCCVETVANNTLNCQHIVVFDQLWANMIPTFNRAFSLTNVFAKWWIHCLLIFSSSLLSHATQFMIGQNEFVEFFGVFRDNCQIWATWAFSISCVCMTKLKVSIPPLNYCFPWSRVWITLIKLLLCLNSIFSHQKPILYQLKKFRFFHWFKNLQQELHLNNCNL